MNAKDYLRYRVENGLLDTPRNLLLNEKWKIFINKHQVTKKIGKAIYEEKWEGIAKRFWIQRWGIKRNLIQNIDWEVFKKN